jgi:hypothetical protein
MRALLRRYSFEVQRDVGLDQIGADLSSKVSRATKRMRHLRLATAYRM